MLARPVSAPLPGGPHARVPAGAGGIHNCASWDLQPGAEALDLRAFAGTQGSQAPLSDIRPALPRRPPSAASPTFPKHPIRFHVLPLGRLSDLAGHVAPPLQVRSIPQGKRGRVTGENRWPDTRNVYALCITLERL